MQWSSEEENEEEGEKNVLHVEDVESENDEDALGNTNDHPWIFQQLGASFWLYENSKNNSPCGGEKASAVGHAPWAARHASGEAPPELQAKLIHSSTLSFRRCQARWYYPIDFPIVQAALKSHPDTTTASNNQNRQNPTKKRKRHKPDIDKEVSQNASRRELTREELSEQTRVRNALNPEVNIQQSMKSPGLSVTLLMDQARETMLDTAHVEDNNDVYTMHNQPQARPDYHWADYCRSRSQKQHQLLQSYQMYDRSYLPAQWRVHQVRKKLKAPELALNDRRCKGSQFLSQQRLDCADPAYLAPFPLAGLMEALQDDSAIDVARGKVIKPKDGARKQHVSSEESNPLQEQHREIPDCDSSDGIMDGGHIGNCVVCVPCTCPVCSAVTTTTKNSHEEQQRQHQEPNWCLLHPIGEMLEIIAASLLKTPGGFSDEAILKTRRMAALQATNKFAHRGYNELNVGDPIRQIEQCGDSTIFLARTTIHVTVFSVVPTRDDSFPRSRAKFKNDNLDLASSTLPPKHGTTNLEPLCWGTFRVTELQRIDLRSFDRHSPSYVPVDVTSHPKFLSSLFTCHQVKFAILSQCPGSSHCNTTIHHFLCAPADGGKEAVTTGPRLYCTKHAIRNLRDISQIVFSRRHPMILWASALSFVRPTPTPDHATRNSNFRPRLWEGHALYEIDLRKDEASFRWSPSAEECVVETVHTISCIAVNWKESRQQSTLWVYSRSAGKMWELDDAFSELRVMNCWTLPTQCDNFGQASLHPEGMFGHKRALIAKPTFASNTEPACEDVFPFFGVLAGAAAYGVQLFQPPLQRPAFQTDNLEVAASTALSSQESRNFALSSVFAGSNRSANSITCGLAAIMLPAGRSLLSENDSDQEGLPGDGRACLNCLVTVNSRGNVSATFLLGTSGGKRTCPIPGRFPVGGHELNLTTDSPRSRTVAPENKLAGGMNLYLSLHGDQSQQNTSTQKRLSTWSQGGDEQTCLRPFKFSDLRHILPTVSSGDNEGRHRLDSGSIQPLRTSQDVVACRFHEKLQHSTGAARILPPRMPSELPGRAFTLANQSDLFSETTRTSDTVDGRSDVTKQLLDSVKSTWKSDR